MSEASVRRDEGVTTEQQLSVAVVPGLPRRLLDTVFNPGRMAATVAEHPRWVGALIVSIVLIGLSVALIPAETMFEAQRRAALERGVEVSPVSDEVLTFIRIAIPAFAVISGTIMTFLVAGVCSVVFAFVLGDEGTYRQYLAVVAHATFVPAVASMLLTPLRISTGDPQLTVSVGSFLVFMPQGYWLNVFRVMDLTQIWSIVITAQGARAIDRRRSFGSAAAILLGFLLTIALVVARFMP